MSSTAFTFENVAKIIWGKNANDSAPGRPSAFMYDLSRLRENGRKEPRRIELELLLRAWEYEVEDWTPAQLKRICKKIGNLSHQ